ncbi:DUF5694 domain-containing protein [Cloacibacterium sp.]|uniref:DUF5694 domain-containing protein n=1 Tax=Cloacibacterium sp. TaxID=1913682 RepID=UPI0039E53D44
MKQLLFKFITPILFFSFLSCQISKKAETGLSDIYFIPTIHKLHQINQMYNYDSVRAIVQRINPDIIAVEIRNIDINEDTTVLKNTYPQEFVMMRKYFPNKKIVGFDWWSKDIETTKASDLPKNYFQNVPKAKQLKLLENDSINSEKMMTCMQYQKKRASIVQKMSLEQILESKDGEWVREYYACIKKQFKDTPYYGIYSFAEERDQHILKNIQNIIKKNKGKRVLILTGDDHFQMLRDKFPNKQL